ncbi:MAG: peptidoglycan DD-metalloendopeptidase family protein [Acidimicrobiia bacterium]
MHPRLLAPFVALVLIAGPGVAGGRAAEKEPSAKETRVNELREQITEVSEQEGALLSEIAAIREKLDELNEAVRKLNVEVSQAQRKLRRAERDLDRAEAERIEVAFKLAQAQAEVESARLAMNLTISALYQRGQSDQQALYAAVVQTSGSPHEIFSALHYLKGAAGEQREDLDRFIELQRQVEVLSEQAKAQEEAARSAHDAIKTERVRLEGSRAQAVAARIAARAEEDREQELLDEVQERKADFLRELQLLQAESSAIGEMLREIQAGQRLAPRRKGTFKLPVNAPMSSRFGYRVHPIFGDTRLHAGVDFSAGSGTPIRASGPGKVVWSGPRGGYGNLVVIDHGNGLATLYAHQSRTDVNVGQRVATGEVVGLVGSTGFSTGPHLHFETRELGTPADPQLYL